ncbi:MAG: hypothetical protein KJ989_07730, partial [Gammaproteobacteria bacterium]|nr:hypothetical protein [Gammaproteobacteria bacterium]
KPTISLLWVSNCAKNAQVYTALLGLTNLSEPAHDLLRVGPTALKAGSECSFTARKLRFLVCFCLVWL